MLNVTFSVDELKTKIKLLKKYSDHLGIDRKQGLDQRSPTLTGLQNSFAKAIGYNSWADLIKVATVLHKARGRSLLKRSTPLADLWLASQKFALSIHQHPLVALGMLLRIGFGATLNPAMEHDVNHEIRVFDILDRTWSFGEARRAMIRCCDLTLERFLELDDYQDEAVALRCILSFVSNKHDALIPSSPTHKNVPLHVQSLVKAKIDQNYGTSEGDKFASPKTYEELAQLLPDKGLVVMSGETGTGRTYSSFALMLALRARPRPLLPLSYSVGLDRSGGNDCNTIFGGEIKQDTFLQIAQLAKASLVFATLDEPTPFSALAAVEAISGETYGPGHGSSWVNFFLVGGVNHGWHPSFHDQELIFWTTPDLQADRLDGGTRKGVFAEGRGKLFSRLNENRWERNADGLVVKGQDTFILALAEQYTLRALSMADTDVLANIHRSLSIPKALHDLVVQDVVTAALQELNDDSGNWNLNRIKPIADTAVKQEFDLPLSALKMAAGGLSFPSRPLGRYNDF